MYVFLRKNVTNVYLQGNILEAKSALYFLVLVTHWFFLRAGKKLLSWAASVRGWILSTKKKTLLKPLRQQEYVFISLQKNMMNETFSVNNLWRPADFAVGGS